MSSSVTKPSNSAMRIAPMTSIVRSALPCVGRGALPPPVGVGGGAPPLVHCDGGTMTVAPRSADGCLRSAACAEVGAPHSGQNAFCSGTSAPHFAHFAINEFSAPIAARPVESRAPLIDKNMIAYLMIRSEDASGRRNIQLLTRLQAPPSINVFLRRG